MQIKAETEKSIVHEISKEDAQASIETLKVCPETLEYLRKKGFKTIHDVIEKQDKIPKNTEETSMRILCLEWKISLVTKDFPPDRKV